jgi:beta-galactosidase
MEQQPGPVNWAHWNPSPLPGMVRLWSWEAFAHGAGCVSYFRWRQAPFAQEQMHAGLNTPDNRLDVGGEEAVRVAGEIAALTEAGIDTAAGVRGDVALVYDYEAKWLFEIHPQGADFHYPRFAFEYYSALRALGLDVDIVPADAPLDGYRMIVVPPLPVVPDDFAARLARSGAQVVLGPRTGSKTRSLSIPETLPPGPLTQLLPIRVWRVESLRPNVTEPVSIGDGLGGTRAEGFGRHWRDLVALEGDEAAGSEVCATFNDGHPAYIRHGAAHYLATVFDASLTISIFARIATAAGLAVQVLDEGVRVSRRGALTYVFNYGPRTYTIDGVDDAAFVIGTRSVQAQGVAAYRTA